MAWLAQEGLVAVDAVAEAVGVAFEEQPLETKGNVNGDQSLQGRRINRIKSLNFKRYLDHYFRTSLMTCRYQDRQCIQFLHLNQLSPVEAWLCHHFVGSTKPLVEFAKTFALSAEQLALD